MALGEIAKNIERIRREIAVNCYGEKVTLVAATKTRTVEEIKEAIDGGVDAIWADMGETVMRQRCRWSASNKRAQGPASARCPHTITAVLLRDIQQCLS